MGVRWRRWIGALVVLLVMGGAGVLLPGASASGGCFPPDRFPATLLARPDVGWPFAGLAVDGEDPYIDPVSNRTIVPLRSLLESLAPGDEAAAHWDAANRTALFQYRERVLAVRYPVGGRTSYSVLLDGQELPIHTFICEGRIYAPARFIVEALGIGIRYHGDGVVIIDPATRPEGAMAPVAGPPPAASGAAAPGASGTAAPVGTGPRAGTGGSPAADGRATPAAAPALCGAWPDEPLQYLISPRATMREAARAAACRVLQAE